jgi:Ala-tRNA(Pro) deacylase
MTATRRLTNYLSISQTDYRLVPHKMTQSAADSAHAAHIPANRVVKSVLLRDRKDGHYTLALTPACNRLNLSWLTEEASLDPVLAREAELPDVFPDCALGAVPGFGQAYNVDVIWDDELGQQPCVYFEAGNHEELIEIDQDDFQQLFHLYPHAVISLPHEPYAVYHADEVRGGVI